jgi:tellurite resistance protein TerC
MDLSTVLLYGLFTLFILVMLAIDLGVFNRTAHVVSLREAVIWSVVWTVLALLFNAGVWWYEGSTKALEFLTGYLIERALSFDNIFVFVIIFSYFAVPQHLHHRALFWGVLGALVTRALFIAAGAALISRFDWILYLFGAILVISGWKMFAQKGVEVHPDRNIFIRLARMLFPVTSGYESGRFFARIDGRLAITPLFLVLLTIETTDVVFAVDSIPAVFGVTQDPFIVYTSNIFAILGLRATYFLLAGIMDTFHYLSHGLSAILIFIGFKMLLAGVIHVPITLSLLIVTAVLAASVVASLLHRRSHPDRPADPHP